MKRYKVRFFFSLPIVVSSLFLSFSDCGVKYSAPKKPPRFYPGAPRSPVAETLHGLVVVDMYRGLEDYDDPATQSWLAAEERSARSYLDRLPQREKFVQQLSELRRYDDESIPHNVLVGDRIFFTAIKKGWDRWAYYTKQNEKAEAELLLDPNKWGLTELGSVYPSRDGKYVAYGVEEAGKENPRIQIIEVATRKVLPDSLQGWRQDGISWLPDNSGFYYSANPLPGTVPAGEEHYWDAVYFHTLGTPADADKKLFFHDQTKEYFHSAAVTECGRYVLFYRSMFYKTEVYIQELLPGGAAPIIPVVTGFDAYYSIDVIENQLVIHTNLDAPMGRVFLADLSRPEKKCWKEIIPEANRSLEYVSGIAGNLYAVYTQDAHTVIKIYDLKGNHKRDLALPTLGSAYVRGYWSRPEIWIRFTSFTCPGSIFKYDQEKDSLRLYHRPAIDVDLSDYAVEQRWYDSKDSTKIPMFIIHRKDFIKNGRQALYLGGYGGFASTTQPFFSTSCAIWLKSGGIIALPGLRGGGEYGEEWHEAGMLDKKQNVFDDFIAAAEWLIANQYTNSDRLVIGGVSNGGLLVGAVMVQRPELFKAVYCGVPLLDMIRYHKFGYANIWAEEYGSAENPDQFKYLLKYSPYHNVVDGVRFPAVLFVGSDNDARCYPLHAMKMTARMQDAQSGPAPIFLLVRKHAGHGGGTTLSESIQEQADIWSFFMDQAGLRRVVH